MSTKRIFSTDTDSSTISVFEESNSAINKIQVIPVGNGPRGAVKFTSLGVGHVSNNDGDTISEIDAKSLRETAKIKVGVAPTGVGVVRGDRYLLSSNSGSDSISIVDLSVRREILQIAVGKQPRHMDLTSDGSYAYVAISGGDYVAKIDIRSLHDNNADLIRENVREINRIFLGAGANPYSVGISEENNHVFVANNQATYISVIDLESDAVISTIDLGTKGARGVAFSPDQEKVYISVEDTSEIVEIDNNTLSIARRLPTGPGPRGMAVDPETGTVYAACFTRTQGGRANEFVASSINLPNSMTVINPAVANLVDTGEGGFGISVGQGPCSIAIFELK
jgi:YVTN family beta-propeller protein